MRTARKKRVRNKKYVKFHRSWNRVLNDREKQIQYQLNSENSDERNETESVSEALNNDMQIERFEPLKDQLKSWSIQNQVSMRSINSLLKILRSNGHIELPNDYRTLLSTPRQIELQNFGDAKYWYHGITKWLVIVFSKLNRHLKIKLIINVDGLPIFNSSQYQFWPILVSVDGEQ